MDTSATGELKNPSENAEARGLIGRAHKQAYVKAANKSRHNHLERAVEAYFEVYSSDRERYLWQGINTVACLCRAERDGIALAGYPDPRTIATEILEALEAITPRDRVECLDRATAVEACIALNRLSDAKDWLAVYVTDPAADAFELASTMRQLTEVWQLLPGTEPGSTVLPILQSALLQREGGQGRSGSRPAGGRCDDSGYGHTRSKPCSAILASFRSSGIERAFNGASALRESKHSGVRDLERGFSSAARICIRHWPVKACS